MPKCLDCGNTENFLDTYIDVDIVTYDRMGDVKVVGSYDRYSSDNPMCCASCFFPNIDWNLHE